MATIQDFKTWAFTDLRRFTSENLRDHCLIEETYTGGSEDYEHVLVLRIYTDINEYRIRAVESAHKPNGYLGCTSSARKTRAGETQHRGSDLADGQLDYDTWIRIIMDILSYEMVRVHHPRKVHFIDTGHLGPQEAQDIVRNFSTTKLAPLRGAIENPAPLAAVPNVPTGFPIKGWK